MLVRAALRRLEHHRAHALAAALLLATVVVLSLPPSAGAFVYWINWSHTAAQGSIGRANLDGTGANQNFIALPTGAASEPHGLAVDGSHIYWSHGAIGRANLDGTGVDENFITPVVGGAYAVAVDASHIYWGGGNAVGRADLGGTNVSTIAGSGVEDIRGIAVYSSPASGGGHIYYADIVGGGTIGRADLDGSQDDDFFIDPAALGQPELVGDGVAVNATGIYWPSISGPTFAIAHADFGPAHVNSTAITNTGTVEGLAVDDTHLYFGTGTGVGRATLSGTVIEPNLITGGGVPPPPVASAAPSMTTVACAPAALTLPGSSNCTTTVTDSAGATAPTGSVALSSSGAGAFGPGASCTLAPSGGAQATCRLTFAPSLVGLQTITASYGGDTTHRSSSATTTLQAAVSNAWVAAKPIFNKKAGTATLVATFPGPGRLMLVGSGVRRQSKRVTRAGKIRLTIRPSTKTAKTLKRHGSAAVKVTLTYTPTGGHPRARTVKLTLRLAH
jgi:hypothetical protein